MQGFPTQLPTNKWVIVEVTMTVMSAVEESRIRNLAKFAPTTLRLYSNCSDTA